MDAGKRVASLLLSTAARDPSLRLGSKSETATLSALLWGKRPPGDRRKEQV